MSDRIILDAMVFQGTHGVYAEEQQTPQPFEVDVELALNLQPAGLSDDLEQTIDYGRVFDTCRQIVESTAVQPHRGPRRGDRPRAPGGLPGRRGHGPGPQAGGPAGRHAAQPRASRSGAAGAGRRGRPTRLRGPPAAASRA